MNKWDMALSIGLLACLEAPGLASDYNFSSKSIKALETRYQTPEDALSLIPVVRYVPRQFSFINHYRVDLSIHEMRIQHLSRHHAPKDCLIALSYSQAGGQSMPASRFDVPLFHSDRMTSLWSPTSMDNYSLRLSPSEAVSSSLRVQASARF